MINRFHKKDEVRGNSLDRGIKLRYEAVFCCTVCKEALVTCEDKQPATIDYLFQHEVIQVEDYFYTLCGNLTCREIFELSPQAYIAE